MKCIGYERPETGMVRQCTKESGHEGRHEHKSFSFVSYDLQGKTHPDTPNYNMQSFLDSPTIDNILSQTVTTGDYSQHGQKINSFQKSLAVISYAPSTLTHFQTNKRKKRVLSKS